MRSPWLSTIAALLCGTVWLAAASAHEEGIQRYLDAAARAAGEDLKPWLRLCEPAPPQRPVVTDERLAQLIAMVGPEAQAAFDNLYFLGSGWVSAWLLATSEGFVLIDTLNNADEVDRLLLTGMRNLGMDPRAIRIILITHGHGDHYGGTERVKALAAPTRPQVVMSKADWAMTATQLEFDSPLWGRPPRYEPGHDIAADDGATFTLGDAHILLVQTPGHTMGTISPIFEVRDGNRTHRAMIWGGTSFNFGRDLQRLDAYIQSAERMKRLVEQHQVDVLLSNHPAFDGTPQKLARLRSRSRDSEPHPFVVGKETVLRALTVAAECARATRARFERPS